VGGRGRGVGRHHEKITDGGGKKARSVATWASLAFDYLAIMHLSVSSECVFSAVGMTITKCQRVTLSKHLNS
jgi:hypothetical protein